MSLLLPLDTAPMEALSRDSIPTGAQWQFEPKWDGFRCLGFRDGSEVHLQSKSGKDLGRYFPEVVAALGKTSLRRYVIDGELVIPCGHGRSFSDLQARRHPAPSRIAKLSAESPAQYMIFDLLASSSRSLLERPLQERRVELERFAAEKVKPGSLIRLSPKTLQRRQAMKWMSGSQPGLDGVMAKDLRSAYRSGERDAMVKVKLARTADCVVGGFRYGTNSPLLASLLLGLYDADGILHHVGFTSSFPQQDMASLTKRFEGMKAVSSFTGRSPGEPSRWSTERSAAWEPVAPSAVVEVRYDHVTDDRFRHGTAFLRWRPDKRAKACTLEQISV